MKNCIAIIFTLILSVQPLHAQRSRDYFTIGIGPSIIYGDNTANYPKLNFKISPSLSIGYNEQINHHFDVRATAGFQMLNSGNTFYKKDDEYIANVLEWGRSGQAKDFLGLALFIDVMPVYNFRPVQADIVGYPWQYYVGLGFGMMNVNRNEERMVGINNIQQADYEILIERRSTTAAYFPLRAGVSTNIEKDYDIGLEIAAFITTSSEIDGNNIRGKLIKPDILFQIQLITKIYLGWD